MLSKRSLEGELMIDHRASPGLPKGFMQSLGLDGWNVTEGKVLHIPTLTCCGCGGVCIKNPDRIRERHHCRSCDSYLCDSCALQIKLGHPHVPHAKSLDQEEKRAYRVQQNSLTSRFNLTKG